METTAASAAAGATKIRIEYVYDYRSRRIAKKHFTWNAASSAFVRDYTIKYVYDGWNLAGEFSEDNTPTRVYVWGRDLSGRLQGAGGIGGLAFIKQYVSATEQAYYSPVYDGSGNVVEVVAIPDTGSGTTAASYEYNPFGELLTSSGPYAADNPFRFSTKYIDSETGLVYFGYRYYNPETGRWLNRDPIEELGGNNLYRFVKNNPLKWCDPYGLLDWPNPWKYLYTGDWYAPEDVYEAALDGAGDAYLETSDKVHTGLDGIGLFPVDLGLSDGLNAVLYGLEGNRKYAIISAISIVPLGDVAKVTKAPKYARQLHHAISKKIWKALEKHRNLKGLYKSRDPRFVFWAGDEAAHRGYQTWHRELDEEVIDWLRANEAATPEEFEAFLMNRYGMPDLQKRFPCGCERKNP